MDQIKVLFLAANPIKTNYLKLDEEIRSISQKVRASEYRDSLQLISAWAVRPDDLLQLLNEHKPNIVHFSGHGNSSGEIILADSSGEPKAVSTKALKALFTALKDNIRVVILNSCYSKMQAEAITEVIDCGIGMNSAIGDSAATTFAVSFCRAVGFGRSVQESFNQGITALLLEGIAEENIPELLTKNGIDPSQVFLTNELLALSPINQPFYKKILQRESFFKTSNKVTLILFCFVISLGILISKTLLENREVVKKDSAVVVPSPPSENSELGSKIEKAQLTIELLKEKLQKLQEELEETKKSLSALEEFNLQGDANVQENQQYLTRIESRQFQLQQDIQKINQERLGLANILDQVFQASKVFSKDVQDDNQFDFYQETAINIQKRDKEIELQVIDISKEVKTLNARIEAVRKLINSKS